MAFLGPLFGTFCLLEFRSQKVPKPDFHRSIPDFHNEKAPNPVPHPTKFRGLSFGRASKMALPVEVFLCSWTTDSENPLECGHGGVPGRAHFHGRRPAFGGTQSLPIKNSIQPRAQKRFSTTCLTRLVDLQIEEAVNFVAPSNKHLIMQKYLKLGVALAAARRRRSRYDTCRKEE